MTPLIKAFFLLALTAATLTGMSAASAATNVEETRALYSELMKFKGERSFHDVGFGICCKYNQWLKKVDALSQKFTQNDVAQLQFTPGDLKLLGLEYIKTQGKENKYTDYINGIIRSSTPAKAEPKVGERVMARTDRGCPSLDILTDFHRALAEGRYGESSRIIGHCPTITKNTVVRGPLNRSTLLLSDGSEIEYLLFSLPDGHQVWISENNLQD